MHGQLSIRPPQLGFEERELPSHLEHLRLAEAVTKLHRRKKAALNFNGGQPSVGLGVRSDRNEYVNHCYGKSALYVAKKVLEGRLPLKAKFHSSRIKVGLFDGERCQGRAVRLGLTVQKAL